MARHPSNPRRALLRLTLVAALGSTAWAHVLERGGTVRVSREAPLREWHLYMVQLGADEAIFRSNNPAVVGARYSVLDERGFLGEAQVSSVETITVQNPGCTEVYYEAHARYQAGPRRQSPQGDLLAVGPASAPLRGARVISRYPHPQRIPPLVDGKQLWLVVDLDGAGDPELFMVSYECQGDRIVRQGTGRERCLELWSREGRRWGVVARARTPICH